MQHNCALNRQLMQKKPTKESYCHADPKDGIADGPCNTDADCLAQMVCYSACNLCFETSVCEYAASVGGIAAQNQTICYNPVPWIARDYDGLPAYDWIIIAGSVLTAASIIAIVSVCVVRRRRRNREYAYSSLAIQHS
eukprot:TRINITY_DN3041_c0_g2_i4.p1 TRINITY_DN3041_c0_g2~~TRINITY_DN3041_c0_g2_i4.p1  ORF type:complete len:138 (+),score=4.39 TRINITY_DN3041_c0_g2_i4:247-660(+)